MSAPAPDELELRPVSENAVTLRLRVSAGAARTRVIGPHGGALKVAVQAPPERGKANRQVLALVAKTFGLPLSSVSLSQGETSPDKVVCLELAAGEALARWAAARTAAR